MNRQYSDHPLEAISESSSVVQAVIAGLESHSPPHALGPADYQRMLRHLVTRFGSTVDLELERMLEFSVDGFQTSTKMWLLRLVPITALAPGDYLMGFAAPMLISFDQRGDSKVTVQLLGDPEERTLAGDEDLDAACVRKQKSDEISNTLARQRHTRKNRDHTAMALMIFGFGLLIAWSFSRHL